MGAAATAASAAETTGAGPVKRTIACCPVLELRQYTLKPGQREVLIGLFDQKFVSGQEEHGISVVGQFRDLDAPDRFVWLRGFASMPQRKQALEDFYAGPVWQDNRNSANATMIDSDNVLLLRPATPSSGFTLQGLARYSRSAGLVVVHLHYLQRAADASLTAELERRLRSALQSADAQLYAVLVSEHAQNTYPALPVRLGEEALVWVAGFADRAAYDAQRPALEDIAATLEPLQARPAERLHLSPTSQSLMRGTREQAL